MQASRKKLVLAANLVIDGLFYYTKHKRGGSPLYMEIEVWVGSIPTISINLCFCWYQLWE